MISVRTHTTLPYDDCIIRQASNISRLSRPVVGNKTVDHPYIVGAALIGAAPTTCSFSTQHLYFNALGKDSCKTRRKTFKFLELVCHILEVSRYVPEIIFFMVRNTYDACMAVCTDIALSQIAVISDFFVMVKLLCYIKQTQLLSYICSEAAVIQTPIIFQAGCPQKWG